MRNSQLSPHGWFEFFNDWGDRKEGETFMCVHCGSHNIVSPGSGKLRGFCTRCGGYVCGPTCLECVPRELLYERLEKGVPELVALGTPRPAVVSVPRRVTPGGLVLP